MATPSITTSKTRRKSAVANPHRDDTQVRLITEIASLECVLGVLEMHDLSGGTRNRLASAEFLLRETIARLNNLEVEKLVDRPAVRP